MERNVLPTKKKPAVISFNFAIDPNSANALIGACSELVRTGHEEIHLLLNSPGGSVAEGISIYNFLQSIPAEIVTYNTGSIDSIAGIIYQAGNLRICYPDATFLIHGVGIEITGRAGIPILEEKIRSLRNDEERIAAIYKRHTKLDEVSIQSMFRQGNSYSAVEARDLGILDDIFVAKFSRAFNRAIIQQASQAQQ